MNETKELTFELLLERLAEKLVTRFSQEPSRLYPRLLTTEQAALYIGLPETAIEDLTRMRGIATVRAYGGDFVDRHDLDDWVEEHKEGWANLTRGANGRRG